jgi:apyrase
MFFGFLISIYFCLDWLNLNGLKSLLTRIKVASQVGSIPLDWALGAFIMQTTADADPQNHNWISAIFSNESPTLFSLLGIFIILLFTAWSISRCRKPQLKTIYDLEKGRYITTRVGR